ncbi:acyl-CoA dehydrogenase family protein [Halorientalis litorea]|jgi:alkylation response protein AidB-like acyl-CoA dehydrogenase|uniref:acyl-CoA dehydrogenase family protein n=1 Tax=Halorientalis litorea TaxID=2931977 RepID=UPI001FF43AD0|nr:acyl-CoA dehydrogenase family protein [Halorientalis litorea]
MIGKDTSLTPEERQYLADTIETLETEVFVDGLGSDHFGALDDNEESQADWAEYVRRMGEADLTGIAVPESHGGPGGSFVETVLAEQAIGYAGTIVHACQVSLSQHIGQTMYQHGDEHIHEAYLRPILDGEVVVSQAYTEPSSGTDLPSIGTTAEQAGDEWILNGEKRFIDFAQYGDFYFLPARTSGDDGDREGISLFVVDADTDGIDIRDDMSDWHGFRGTGAAWMAFENVHVPDANLVGEAGGAWPYMNQELNLEHLTVARYCLGASQKALEVAADYTENREVNDRPISDYQAVNHEVAEMATKLDAAYMLNTRAARVLDEDGLSAGRMESAMAKWYGNDLAHEMADDCIQIMGGIATTDNYPIERTQRDVRAGRFLGGASEVMKSITQHYAYKTLTSDEFNPAYVGNELDEVPWRDAKASPPADDD